MPANAMPKDDNADRGKLVTYGLQICVGVGLGVWGGRYLDRRFGWTVPWGTLIGAMVGLAAGMYLMIKDALKANKD
jgi:F0F1-type ATP synthase assembly protein I